VKTPLWETRISPTIGVPHKRGKNQNKKGVPSGERKEPTLGGGKRRAHFKICSTASFLEEDTKSVS